MLDSKLIRLSQDLGTADFLVHHIHAFTIHAALLILTKGILYGRNTRLVSDKLELGFRFPCDGPGRGGTCQLSAWDHIYLTDDYSVNSSTINGWLTNFLWSQAAQVIQTYGTYLSGYG